MVEAIRLFESNYSYLIIKNQDVLIVDPGKSQEILEVLKGSKLTPVGILLTHHHQDHNGGVNNLLKEYPNLVVIENKHGSANFKGFSFETIFTPGHTADSYSFYFKDEGVVFTGDTLFIGLCGRVFDGSIKDLYNSLQTLSKLPPETKVYTGHEYLHYSLAFMKETGWKSDFYNSIKDKTNPSLLSTIGDELINNQFMTMDFDEFKYLRELKG